MYEPYVGCIVPWAGSYAPNGWAYCIGQTLSIHQYPALFAVIGTTYGGDGVNTFLLPDLKDLMLSGTAMVGTMPPGRVDLQQGEAYTGTTTTIYASNLPQHTHSGAVSVPVTLPATSALGGLQNPASGSMLATGTVSRSDPTLPYLPGAGTVSLAAGPAGTIDASIQPIGTAEQMAVGTVPPYVVISYIIAIEGDFPPRPD